MNHEPRLDYHALASKSARALSQFSFAAGGPDKRLKEIVNLRISQINGCAFCIDMHTKDARAAGETEQRLYGLSAWREVPYYTERERAALAWAEVVTLISQTHASDEEYEAARAQFGEEELVKLTMAVIAINGWNRLAIAFRTEAGKYQPRGKAE
jgi:AhpD family alkylhydroperoxidase